MWKGPSVESTDFPDLTFFPERPPHRVAASLREDKMCSTPGSRYTPHLLPVPIGVGFSKQQTRVRLPMMKEHCSLGAFIFNVAYLEQHCSLCLGLNTLLGFVFDSVKGGRHGKILTQSNCLIKGGPDVLVWQSGTHGPMCVEAEEPGCRSLGDHARAAPALRLPGRHTFSPGLLDLLVGT